MSNTDLSTMSDEQLVHHELNLERALVTAKFRLATNQLEDSSMVKKVRRDIARARTAGRARELEQGLNKNSLRDRYATTFTPAGAADQDAGEGSGFLKGIVDKLDSNE